MTEKRMTSKIVILTGLFVVVVLVAGATACGDSQSATADRAVEQSAPATAPASPSATPNEKNGFDGMPAPGTKAFCPVMKNEFTVDENSQSSEHKGKTYVFCCPGCKPAFDANPAKYI